eukprot:scaffold2951_cov17-Tisochrysis_lutea.AAC.1
MLAKLYANWHPRTLPTTGYSLKSLCLSHGMSRSAYTSSEALAVPDVQCYSSTSLLCIMQLIAVQQDEYGMIT